MNNQPEFYSIQESMEMLNLSRSTIVSRARNLGLGIVKVGTKKMLTKRQLKSIENYKTFNWGRK